MSIYTDLLNMKIELKFECTLKDGRTLHQ